MKCSRYIIYVQDDNFKNSISPYIDDEPPPIEGLFSIPDKSFSSKVDFNSVYTSLSVKRHPLFETNFIHQFESLSSLSSMLEVDENVKLTIITVIGKQDNNEDCLANRLLLKDSSYKFPNSSETSLVCRMAVNSNDLLLVLQTEDMYKSIEGKTSEQLNMLRLLLSLSDVIIFTQTTSEKPEDGRRCIKRDYLRIHDIMGICKKEFITVYRKINKKEPEKLAPGLIYLAHIDFQSNESLSESIVETTGRVPLFESFSKILRYDGQDDEMFQDGLRQILQDLSEYRMKHSLENVLTCINHCRQSLIPDSTEPFSPYVPNEWFLCRQLCGICSALCIRQFCHEGGHDNGGQCIDTEENRIYFCKKCIKDDCQTKNRALVYKAKAKEENFLKSAVWYPIRGRVIECEKHGIINDNNYLCTYYEDTVVTTTVHKWPGSQMISQNVYPMSQMVIDKVSQISRPIHKVISDSADTITDNFIIPNNWEKTSSAIECRCCKRPFTSTMSKHHCRSCTYVVCTACVSEGPSQALCSSCVDSNTRPSNTDDPTGLRIVNSVKSPWNFISSFVKKTVTSINRPYYWEDDSKSVRCFICSEHFDDEMRPIHHCRACGRCVCDACSGERRSVEWRCLHEPARICDDCIDTDRWKTAPHQ